MQLDVQDYWNKVERAVRNSVPGRIVDNFSKRRMLVEALLRYPLLDASIVEIGPGIGLTAYALGLITGRIKYTGVDISQTYATAAKNHFGLNVVVHDVTDGLPFPDESADCFFAFDSMEHIQPEKRPGLFREMDRVLKKDDRIIFINNPLDESKHDVKYDFSFDEKDISDLAKATNTKILEIKLLRDGVSSYQFIVLGTLCRPAVKP